MADTFAVDFLEEEVRELGLGILSAVAYSTPVDTGQARGNWVVTFDTPPMGNGVDNTDRDGGRTVREGERVLNQLKGRELPATIYLSNNLPYIEQLNEGWSAKAPAKFIDSAIERVVAASG